MKLKVHRVYFTRPVNHPGSEFVGISSINEETTAKHKTTMIYDTEDHILYVKSQRVSGIKVKGGGDKEKVVGFMANVIDHMLFDGSDSGKSA